MIRGRGRFVFLIGVVVASIVLGCTESRNFFSLAAAALIILVQVYWGDHMPEWRPDRAPVAERLRFRRARRRDGS